MKFFAISISIAAALSQVAYPSAGIEQATPSTTLRLIQSTDGMSEHAQSNDVTDKHARSAGVSPASSEIKNDPNRQFGMREPRFLLASKMHETEKATAVVSSGPSYISLLRRQRDSWMWDVPGNEIVWKVFVDQAELAGKTKDYKKQLALLEAAIEHTSCFKPDDERRLETITKLKQCAQKLGYSVDDKQVQELILPPNVGTDKAKYKMKPMPRKSPYKPVGPVIDEADQHVVDGASEKAVPMYLKSLKSLQERPIRDGQAIVKLVDRLTRIYYREGRLAEAEILVRKELKERESMHDRLDDTDPDKLQIAFLLGDLALTYSGVDRLYEAEALYKSASYIVFKHLTDRHYDYIVTLGELARVHKLMGRYNEAEKEYKTALNLAKNDTNVTKQTRGVIFGNYAKLLEKMGKHRMAEEMQARSTDLLAGSAMHQ